MRGRVYETAAFYKIEHNNRYTCEIPARARGALIRADNGAHQFIGGQRRLGEVYVAMPDMFFNACNAIDRRLSACLPANQSV